MKLFISDPNKYIHNSNGRTSRTTDMPFTNHRHERHAALAHACMRLLSCVLLICASACAQTASSPAASHSNTTARTSTNVNSATPGTAPAHYTAHLLLQGYGHPDDLAFDPQGRLLFSDERSGTINRLNANGSVTRLLNDPAGPEGMVVLHNGSIIFAEQTTNRILSLAPGSKTPTLLRTLPGTPGTAPCKQGVDGIALDTTTNTLIVPDSPAGTVYRMSLDGKSLTLLASGIVRPVGAGGDTQGNIYVADECGHAIWQIAPNGKTTRINNFGMPDDVISDGYGNLLVIDLAPSVHALLRLNLGTGHRETLASQNFIEPQGIAIDAQGNLYVSDDYANLIIKYTPA